MSAAAPITPPSIDLEEDGFVPVTMKQPDGKAITVNVDLQQAYNTVLDLAVANKGTGDNAYLQGVADYMQKLGLPSCSLRLAGRFADRLMELVAALKKKDATIAGSPASTAVSTPSESPAAFASPSSLTSSPSGPTNSSETGAAA